MPETERQKLIIELEVADSGAVVITDSYIKQLRDLKTATEGVTKAGQGAAGATDKLSDSAKIARRAFFEAGATFFVFNQALAAMGPLFSSIDQHITNVIQTGARFEKSLANIHSIVGDNARQDRKSTRLNSSH